MASGEVGERKLSACCISHLFHSAASKFPDKIAVIHAAGFAQIARDFRSNAAADDVNPKILPTSCSFPPVYSGDECFTFAELLSAVGCLSSLLRHILDGGDHPFLIKPARAKISGAKSEHVSGSLMYSNETAHQFKKLRNGRSPIVVGIYMEPTVAYIVAVLSVLRCGEAFMPLDPAMPKERILSLLSSSRSALVIGRKSAIADRCFHGVDALQWLIDDGNCPVLPICLKEIVQEQCESSPVGWPCENENPGSFCYVMYTSGSTGNPKGVCGTEIGLLNRYLWMQESYPIHGGDVLLFKTPISFIDHMQEFLGALLTACTLVIPPFHQLKENIFYVVDFLQGYFVKRLVAVPSLIRAILPALQSQQFSSVRDSLKLLVLSGELLQLSLCKMLLKLLPQTSILNLYGSTEVTGDCTYFDCKRLLDLENEELKSVPIGLPIMNCDVLLFGEDASHQGEIIVGGLCVAAGYLNYPYLTPLAEVVYSQDCDAGFPSDGHRVQHYFRTGDFACKIPSGDLVFLGRKDRTIKLNGQRIALEEIESVLRYHSDVVDAAVVYREVEEEIFILEAHVVMDKVDEDDKLLKSSLRNWLFCKLPPMMVPTVILFTRSLPLTSSGKVDYKSLAAPIKSDNQVSGNLEELPPDHLVQVVRKVFSDALMVDVSVDDDFFEMGGNSISAAFVAFKLGIHMKFLYTFPTASKLHMALLTISSARTGTYLGVDFGRPERSMHPLLESETLNFNRRLFGTETRNDGYNTSKKLKTNMHAGSKEQSPTGGSWSPSAVHTTCSFNRCNKSLHTGNCDLCGTVQLDMASITGNGILRELWRVNLNSCVDASPLVVFKGNDVYLFIGSHSHNFICVDAKSGSICWDAKLNGRVECSAEILDDFSQVVVGCYQGNIYFLRFSTGNICWTFQTNGEVKSQPVVDRCRHLVWCGSYDHNMYAIDYKNYCCIYKICCHGSIFGSPAIDEARGKLCVASTSGHLMALSLKVTPFEKSWDRDMGVPIFSSLMINGFNGNIICCLVDGNVFALSTDGSIIWKATTGGPIFAGPCTSQALPSQVLICSRDGSIYSFEMETGILLWKHAVGHPITSSPYVDECLTMMSNISHEADRLICVCDSSGCVHVLRVDSNSIGGLEQNKQGLVQEIAQVNLGGEIFSSPVMIGGRIFVGCRDDHLYSLELDFE